MKSYLLLFSLFTSTMLFATPPSWTVNSTSYSAGFSINAVLNINGSYSVNTNDLVAAFDNDDSVRGTSNLVYDSGLGAYIVYLTVLGNTAPDSITFKIYNALGDTVYEAINDPVIFVPNQLIGTVGTPYVITNTNFSVDFSMTNSSVDENQTTGTYVGDLNTLMILASVTTFNYSFVAGLGG
ncbi:MAG: hypothetical protein JKY54_15790, partial [Flavobacteriales bacterium]|nr:hypothetical protein [Flavobacteriales bacterium]